MKALIAGATGLIGNQLLELCLQDKRYDTVIAITRRPLSIANPKLKNVIADLTTLEKCGSQLAADDVFCCLGTTMKIAKTKEAFLKVDLEYPVKLAELTIALGAKQYFLVSALGANKSSAIFYNRVKGMTEEAIDKIGFESYHILRPSLLVGPRVVKRAVEETAVSVYKYLRFLIPAKYQSIESIKVARAMLTLAGRENRGHFIHESNELQGY